MSGKSLTVTDFPVSILRTSEDNWWGRDEDFSLESVAAVTGPIVNKIIGQ